LTAAQLLGVTMNSLINKPFNVFVHPSDKDVFFLHLRRLRKSLSETCEIRLVKKGAAFFHAQTGKYAARQRRRRRKGIF